MGKNNKTKYKWRNPSENVGKIEILVGFQIRGQAGPPANQLLSYIPYDQIMIQAQNYNLHLNSFE